MPELLQITSLQNDLVKHARALERRKERKESGEFVAEGAKVIATARDHGWTPEVMFVSGETQTGIVKDLVAWAKLARAKCVHVTYKIAEALTDRDNPQPVIGVFKQRWAPRPASAMVKGPDVWVALEEVRDPGNLGTIIRTVDAVGATGVILVGTCCDPYSREAVRATMGSIFSVPLVAMERADFLAWRGAWPGDVIGTHLKGADDYRRDYRGPVLLMMGGEGPGLSDGLANGATRLVKIPMDRKSGADSLNLAVASALMLYEIRRGKLV